jgi:tetratricopeptide (TPR) repeat protein
MCSASPQHTNPHPLLAYAPLHSPPLHSTPLPSAPLRSPPLPSPSLHFPPSGYHLDQAIERRCQLPIAFNSRGTFAFYNGNLEEALLYYDATIRANAQAKIFDPDAMVDAGRVRNMWALALVELGREDEALEQYHKVLEDSPNMFEILSNAASIHMKRGRGETAMDMYQRAFKMHPGQAAAANNMGWAHESFGHREEAYFYYSHALSLAPAHPQIRRNAEKMRGDAQ